MLLLSMLFRQSATLKTKTKGQELQKNSQCNKNVTICNVNHSTFFSFFFEKHGTSTSGTSWLRIDPLYLLLLCSGKVVNTRSNNFLHFPYFLFFFSGSMQFPYNPLTMRILSNTPPTSIASPSIQSQQQQPPSAGAPVAQQRVWQSLLSEQYETLSDSDDWELLIRVLRTARDICTDVYLLSPPHTPSQN